jgi:tetratricopeptide (TPR) repeat protein
MKTNSSKFQYIFILGLVVLTASIARAKVAAPQDEKNDVIDSSRIARSKLRQTGILSMETMKTSDTKNRLAQLIARLQALKPPKPKQTVAPEIQPVQSVEPKSVTGQSASTPPKENQTRTSNSRAVDEDEIERSLAALLDNPQSILDPLSVAQALFRRGSLSDAAKFYRLAIEAMADKIDHPDRPWALFQNANCIRRDDPLEAYKLYQQLIADYPNSHWTPAALAQQQIITWYQQNKPANTLEKYISEPNSF